MITETGDELVAIVKSHPARATDLLIYEDIRKLLSRGDQVADLICAVPEALNLLYPFCYLLTEPDDCARVMSQICLHGEFDASAPLACVVGDINWALCIKPLTYAWLYQLMCSLEKIYTPRSRLTQAYLLIEYGTRDEITPQKRGKYYHDAICRLANLYPSNPKLHKVIKFLLLTLGNHVYDKELVSPKQTLQLLDEIQEDIGRFSQIFFTSNKYNQHAFWSNPGRKDAFQSKLDFAIAARGRVKHGVYAGQPPADLRTIQQQFDAIDKSSIASYQHFLEFCVKMKGKKHPLTHAAKDLNKVALHILQNSDKASLECENEKGSVGARLTG